MAGFVDKIGRFFGFNKDTGSLEFMAHHMTPESLQAFATKYNLRVQKDERGSYISVSRTQDKNDFISFYENWCNTYTNTANDFSGNRNVTLSLYDVMDENMTEISQTLDTYAEEAISYGIVENAINITCSDDGAYEVLMRVLEKNKIFRRERADIRAMCKYGDAAYVLTYPKEVWNRWEQLPEEEKANKDPLEFFNVDDLIISPVNAKNFSIKSDETGEPIYYETSADLYSNNHNGSAAGGIMTKTWQPWQFVRFSLIDDITRPYGKSILYGMRTLYDQLSTLEALLAMSRASKVSRLIIRVPVPGDNAVEAFAQLSQAKAMFKSQIFSDAAGTKSGRKVAGLTETLFMPAGEGYEIDTLKNDIDISSTDDVDHFTEKALRATRLPKGFFAGDGASDTGAALAERDQKFSKALLTVQDGYVSGLVDLCACILTFAGYDINEVDVEVSIERPTKLSKDTIEQYKTILDAAVAIRDTVQSSGDKSGYGLDTNFAQLLVMMGIPSDYIKLCLAKNPISILDQSELSDLFTGLEVAVYNQKKSEKYNPSEEENKETDKSAAEEGENKESEDNNEEGTEDSENTENTENSTENSSLNKEDNWTGGIDPENTAYSVSSSKQLRICESGGVMKVVSRASIKKNILRNPTLKTQLKEVLADLKNKHILNG